MSETLLSRLTPEILTTDGKKQFAVFTWKDYQRIRDALQDLEDLRALDQAKAANAGRRGIPLSEVKQRLKAKARGTRVK